MGCQGVMVESLASGPTRTGARLKGGRPRRRYDSKRLVHRSQRGGPGLRYRRPAPAPARHPGWTSDPRRIATRSTPEYRVAIQGCAGPRRVGVARPANRDIRGRPRQARSAPRRRGWLVVLEHPHRPPRRRGVVPRKYRAPSWRRSPPARDCCFFPAPRPPGATPVGTLSLPWLRRYSLPTSAEGHRFAPTTPASARDSRTRASASVRLGASFMAWAISRFRSGSPSISHHASSGFSGCCRAAAGPRP